MTVSSQLHAPQPRLPSTQQGTARPPAEPRIEAIRLQGSMVRGSRPFTVCMRIADADVTQLEVTASTPGFQVSWYPRAVSPDQVVLTLRVVRTSVTRARLCLLRFQLGRSSAAASITVVDD